MQKLKIASISSGGQPNYRSYTRVYLDIVDSGRENNNSEKPTVLELMMQRYEHPWREYRKVMPEVLAQFRPTGFNDRIKRPFVRRMERSRFGGHRSSNGGVMPSAMRYTQRVVDLPYTSDQIEFWWSQRAGCNCPCSPGMVVNDILEDKITGDRVSDIYVTLTIEEAN